MAALPFGTTFRRLLHRIDARPAGDRTDGALLGRFAANRDEAAFAALVARHGPMVLGLCRRVLGDADHAEDAFQATFLVLARKAGSLDGNQPMGSWLYTVARNLALKLRGRDSRRRTHEKEAGAMPKTSPRDEIAWREVCAVLDAELGRLPEKYRAPLVLCHLQGMTHEAAAKELGWPAGSMAKRLARGQELLRERLTGRGVTLSAAALLLLMTQKGAAAVPAGLATGTGKAAVQFVARKTTAGLASSQAITLAGGALRAMTMTKLKIAAALLLGAGMLVAGAGAGYFALNREVPVAEQPGNNPLPRQPAPAPAPVAKADDAAADAIRRKLDQPVNLDKGIDANTPLMDALDFFGDRHDLKFTVAEDAFLAHGVLNITEQPIVLPRMVGVRLRVILGLLLGQIALDNGMIGGFRIKGATVEVVPVDPSEPGDRWLSAKLARRLLRPVVWNRDIPAEVPLGKILELVGSCYGEKFAIDDKAFKALGGVSPRASTVAPLKLAGRSESLFTVLELLLEQVRRRDCIATFRVNGDVIEITAVKPGSAEAKAAGKSLEAVWERRDADRNVARMAAKLDRPAAKEVVIDPNTPLKDALEFLSSEFDLTIIIDSKAFESVGIQKVEEETVQLRTEKNVKVSAIVRQMLEQVHRGDWVASCIVRQDYIEVAPMHLHVKQKKALTKQQLDDFWADLAGSNWRQPVMAADTLLDFPDQTVLLLGERVRPVPLAEPKIAAEADRWVKGLDSDQFAVREKATSELDKLGKAAIPALRQALDSKPSLDMRHRIEQLLEKLNVPITPEQLREMRAIHLLEAIGTPEAERLLEKLAKGSPGAWTTEKAKAALARLNP